MIKGCVLPRIFDSIPIWNYIYSLLHAEIFIGNKIIGWRSQNVQCVNWLTNLIESKQRNIWKIEEEQLYNADLRIERQLIESL